MERVALVGEAVAHSPSPAMHTAGFAALGLDWEYVVWRVPPGGLETAWRELKRRFRGLNVTSPHKPGAARLADRLSLVASACGAVNTVQFAEGQAFGDCTDGAGFMAALSRSRLAPPEVAAVLGTGGAARAVAAALAATGTRVRVLGRNSPAGQQLAADLAAVQPGRVQFCGGGQEAYHTGLDGAQLLVNATPLGGVGSPQASPLPGTVRLDRRLAVFDLVYRRDPTPLLARAVQQGCRVIPGIEMLVEQGLLSFQIWTGRAAPAEVMRRAARSSLGFRA
ncbi:MAG: shikimate dehydrogenase family protein [Streptosporangiaceae bacterium]